MQVRCEFVHMQMRREYPKLWIALLKPGVVFFERFFCLPADLGIRLGILPVADLDDNLVELLSLFSVDDVLIVVRYDAIAPFLLFVIPCELVVKEFVIDRFDLLVTEIRVQMRLFRIRVLCVEFSAVVVRRAFSDLDANRSFQ